MLSTCRLLLGLLPPPLRCLAHSGRSLPPSPPAAPIFMSAPSALIEVERKYAAATDASSFQQQVEQHGGEVLGHKRFTDVYYDTIGCSLTSRDIWLRARDGEWELKLPLDDEVSAVARSGGERTVFKEVVGAAEVSRELEVLLPTSTKAADADDAERRLEQILRAAGATPFAEFETVRSRYRLGDCAIDADIASFGHSVLEIEVMCCSREEVPAAEAEIQRVATLVGVTPLGDSGGKLETYIRRFCPMMLQKLIEANILPASLEEPPSQ